MMNKQDTTSEIAPPNEGELLRRLPEIQMVQGDIRDEVVRVFLNDAPDYFWIARGAKNHHQPDERGLGGLWLHTKRVFLAYTQLSPTFEAMGVLSGFERNCGRAACLLHDIFKYGRYDVDDALEFEVDEHEYADGLLAGQPGFDRTHDVTCGTFVREETDLPVEVARAIETHGGSTHWGGSHSGPSPSDLHELAVHLADLMAASPIVRWPVIAPSEELTVMVGDDIPVVGDEHVEALFDR